MSEVRETYTVRIHSEPGHELWAEVDELPGCFASGADMDELREALSDSLTRQRKLEVTYRPFDRTTRVPPGTTLFSAAHWIGLPIDSTCGGRGTKQCHGDAVPP